MTDAQTLELLDRLRMLEHQLADMWHRIPGMTREVRDMIRELEEAEQ